MKRLNLYSQQTGHWNGYNSSMDPTISNNFATAAFRFAHTLIPVNYCHCLKLACRVNITNNVLNILL